MDDVDEAMSRYARGDATAFDAVYEAVAPRLTRYLRRRVPDHARREDILQQTFLQMHCARGTFIAGAQVMPWAFSIARRLVIDAGRAGRRESHVELDDGRLVSQAALAAREPTGEEEAAVREAGAHLARALTTVSEPQRAAFELVKTEGMSHAQAAAILGTSVMGIKLRLHRVYVVLRGALEASEKPRLIPAVTAFHGFETREPVVATPRLPHSAGHAPAQKEKRHAKHDHDPGRSWYVVRSRRAGFRPAEEAVPGRP